MKIWRLLPVVLLLWVGVSAAEARTGLVPDPGTCLECHEGVVDADGFAESVHARNGCTSCHVEITDLDRHMEGEIAIGEVNCARCHDTEAVEHFAGIHGEMGMGCTECHTDIHVRQLWDGKKETAVATCMQCHEADDYQNSVHAQSLFAGNEDAPACHDCHGLHTARATVGRTDREAGAFRSEACIQCHQNEELMAENGVYPHAVETYLESYHGKSYVLGFPERAAGCADCHGAHGVLPEEDPASTLHGENRVETCGSCHPGATLQFTKFFAHGDHSDSEHYPILYWTFLGMTGLLIGTFGIFWLHTLFWMFRGFVENRQKIKFRMQEPETEEIVMEAAFAGSDEGTGARPMIMQSVAVQDSPGMVAAGPTMTAGAHAVVDNPHKLYRRFEMRHILLHLTVIISFLGLSLTGLPLKFSAEPWAKAMMSFYGGVYYAGLIHRACAILTFYYFLGALIMSVDFLFVRKDVRTIGGHRAHWLQRLFGPDSLMPNFKDLRDIQGMIRWFFFRGPKPTFERWTYWEKFDFLAVFWGMFAIGGSGLLLWFPELFGSFLPGWMFNVATIVHSDEALLATGFIFTVHFFNTHGRPEKFPMDFVIFNGEMSKEEFIEERGDQWKRYEQLGMTEDFEVTRPSGVLYDFLFKGFGFLALFTGLGLAFLMFLAFVRG